MILRFGLSGILLFYLYHLVDVEKTVAVFRSVRLEFIFYAFLTSCVMTGFLLLRWFIFIWAFGIKIPVFSVVRYFFIGLFGNLFMPTSIGGDVIKVLGLCRFTDEKPKVVASVILDRISGFLGMIVVAFFAFIFSFSILRDFSLLVMILGMAMVAVLMLAVLFHEPFYAFFVRAFSRFPKLQKSLMEMHYDIALLKDQKSAFYKAVAISSLGQIVCAVCYYLLSLGLLQDVRLIYFIIFVPLITVASAFPSIGGLGVREAGIVFLLAKVGVDSGISVSLGLLNFLFMMLTGIMGGIFFAATQSVKSAAPAGFNTSTIS